MPANWSSARVSPSRMLVGVLALGDHVGLADRVGLVVDLLAVQPQPRVRVQPGFSGCRSGAPRRPRACRRCRRSGRRRCGRRPSRCSASSSLGEQQVDHQPDRVARGEVLTGGLVGGLGELADQLLEQVAHLGVADRRRGAGRPRRTSGRRGSSRFFSASVAISFSNWNRSNTSMFVGEAGDVVDQVGRAARPGRRRSLAKSHGRGVVEAEPGGPLDLDVAQLLARLGCRDLRAPCPGWARGRSPAAAGSSSAGSRRRTGAACRRRGAGPRSTTRSCPGCSLAALSPQNSHPARTHAGGHPLSDPGHVSRFLPRVLAMVR